MKRALFRCGFKDGWDELDGAAVSAEVLGATAVGNLKSFQTWAALPADGIYGPRTHAQLTPWFDDYAAMLYGQPPAPPLGRTVQLPSRFTPTHQTEGLPGFPAVDVFAAPGTMALAPEAGRVTRLSGHDPKEGGSPGGPYGWSVYLTVPHAVYFLTHFATRVVTLGQTVAGGDPLGTVCNAAVAGMASSASHVHEGKHQE